MKRPVLITTKVLGVWLVVAPVVLGYSDSFTMAANDVILGVLLVACSWWIATSPVPAFRVSGLQALFSIWLIMAPFVFAFAPWSHAMINDVVVGLIALVVTVIDLWMVVAPPIRTA